MTWLAAESLSVRFCRG
jgi:hypothetical protein